MGIYFRHSIGQEKDNKREEPWFIIFLVWVDSKQALLLSPVSFVTKYIEDVLRVYFDGVVLLSSVREGVEYMKTRGQPDLILGAYLLSDGDLFDFIEACKVENIKPPPIVMITSEEDEDIVKRALHLGILDVINRKVLKEKLQEFLEDFISRVDLKKLSGTILCVEDSRVYSDFIKKSLEKTGLKLVNFERADEAYEYLRGNHADLIVVDFLLKGEYSGLDLIRRVRKELRLRAVPIMVITGFDDMNRRLELFKAGADDYLFKPFSGDEFLIKVHNLLKRYMAIRECEERMEKMKEQYLRDPLTGAYNRNVFEFLEKEIQYANRYELPFSLAIFDFDNFKEINDNYGHAAGDMMLTRFAKTVLANIRQTDYLVRYGGDEFILAMPGADLKSAVKKVEEVIRKFQQVDTGDLRMGVSAGVSCLQASKALKLEELMKMADEALYRAKRAGKNRVESYGGEPGCV